MAHNTNYGRAWNCIFIILNLFLDNLLFNRDFNLLFNLCAKLGCNDCGGIIIDNLINRCHNAEGNKLFNNLICRHSEQTCKIADGNFLGNLNFNLLLLSLLGNSGKALLLGFPFGMSPDALRLFLSVLL